MMKLPKPITTSLTLAALALATSSSHAALVNVFTDTFYNNGATNNDPSVNLDNAAPGGTRTTGTAATAIDTAGYGEGGVLSPTTDQQRLISNTLELTGDRFGGSPRVWAGPDYNFDSTLANQTYKISYTVDLANFGGASGWAGFVFGATTAGDSSQGQIVNNNMGGIGFLIRQGGDWNLFDGTDGSAPAVVSGTSAAGVKSVEFLVTETPTTVQVDLSINGSFKDTYTMNSGFVNNHMAFSVNGGNDNIEGRISVATYDDFNITIVPEPSSAALLGLGGLALALRRLRG